MAESDAVPELRDDCLRAEARLSLDYRDSSAVLYRAGLDLHDLARAGGPALPLLPLESPCAD